MTKNNDLKMPIDTPLTTLFCLIDGLHRQYPVAGSRRMRELWNRQGHHIGRRHTRTLMN